MRPTGLPALNRYLALLGLALLLLGCDTAETSRQVILTRPNNNVAAAPLATALPTAPTIPPLPSVTPPPLPTPTLAPQIAEYDAVVSYWNSSIALTNQITDAYNAYVATTTAYDTFATYQQHKDVIVPASDQVVTVIDRDLAALQALQPPSRAAAYHSAVVQYWQEQRAYISDLRQAIDHDSTDLWNQGIARQPKLATLEANREAAQAALYNNYLVLGRAK